MKIPPHVEHVDCPECVGNNLQILLYGKTTNPNCKHCHGEGVVREDGEPTLKTRIKRYVRPQFRKGSLDGEI